MQAEIEQNKLNMREMGKKESDLLILGLLESLKHNAEKNYYGEKRKGRLSLIDMKVC